MLRPSGGEKCGLVHPRVNDQSEKLRRTFQGNKPFRHIVIDSFLASGFLEQLTAEFPPFDPKQALNEFGEVGRKAVVQNLRRLGRSYQEFDRLVRSGEFLSLVEKITDIPKLLYDPDYAGGGCHENLDGQELDPHVDFNYHPHGNLHRRLNLILFLNPEWDPAWGGALELHEDPWLAAGRNRITTIQPAANRCVIFETSEHSWHGFPKIDLPADKKHLSRRSIAVYFYTKQRPPPGNRAATRHRLCSAAIARSYSCGPRVGGRRRRQASRSPGARGQADPVPLRTRTQVLINDRTDRQLALSSRRTVSHLAPAQDSGVSQVAPRPMTDSPAWRSHSCVACRHSWRHSRGRLQPAPARTEVRAGC